MKEHTLTDSSTPLLISVVIPYFNRAHTLHRTLCSVYNQTYRPIELILVDNGSNDTSNNCCSRFESIHQSEDFHIVRLTEQKKGANAARNCGLNAANGQYITFFDSDDEMFPHMIETIVRAIIQQNNPDIIAYTHLTEMADGTQSVRVKCRSNKAYKQIIRGMLATQDFTVRTSLLKSLSGWNEELSRWQDWEMTTRLLMQTDNVYWLSAPPLSIVHFSKESITGVNYHSSDKALYKAVKTVYNFVNNSESTQKKKLIKAVCFRYALLAGLYTQEGEKEKGNFYFNKLYRDHLRGKPYLTSVCYFVYKYTACGGRGAWLFAYLFL